MPLANIAWSDDQKVFESDIDQKFQELLARRDNGSKRPDIALFNKEGSAIIVEFKAPGVKMGAYRRSDRVRSLSGCQISWKAQEVLLLPNRRHGQSAAAGRRVDAVSRWKRVVPIERASGP
jgi:hypothetical protein